MDKQPAANRIAVLPREIHEPHTLHSVVGVVQTWVMFYGAIAMLAWLAQAPLPGWLRVPAALLACVIGGYGMLDMGFVGHDGFHFSLHRNKTASALMGIAANLPIFFPVTGFAVSHWNHHRFTNGAQDPDVQIFGRFQTFPSRVLFARPFAFAVYLRNATALALGRDLPYPYSFPLPYAQMQRFARINLLGSLLSLGATAAALGAFPVLRLPFLLVAVSGSMISGLSPYVEHTGTGLGRGQDTRTSPGWWRDRMLMYNNYHLEHHLYPTVPAYHLKRAYECLRRAGYYDEPRIVTRGYWQALKTTFSDHPYPNFGDRRQPPR